MIGNYGEDTIFLSTCFLVYLSTCLPDPLSLIQWANFKKGIFR